MGGLNEHLTGHDLPGIRSKIVQKSEEVLTDTLHFKLKGVVIPSDVEDDRTAGNSGLLEPGLVLVRVEAGGANQGKYVEPGHADAPIVSAIEKAVVLKDFVNMADPSAPTTFVDKGAPGILHGFVDNAKLTFSGLSAPDTATVKAIMKLVEFEDLP